MKTDIIYGNYVEALRNLKNDPSIFSTFKSNKNFTDILEHISYQHGEEYLNLIGTEFAEDVRHFLDLVRINDAIGAPVRRAYGDIEMSPSNLRYIYHALLIGSKCKAWFSKPQLKIVEIGGGYGGLCFYIKNILKEFDIDYTIIDLPEPSYLQRLYLDKTNQKNTHTVSCFDIDSLAGKQFDLVISNYCLSEISLDNQQNYFDKIIKNCDKKFFVWNYLTRKRKFFLFKSMDIDFLKKEEYVFEDERPHSGVNKFIYSKTRSSQ